MYRLQRWGAVHDCKHRPQSWQAADRPARLHSGVYSAANSFDSPDSWTNHHKKKGPGKMWCIVNSKTDRPGGQPRPAPPRISGPSVRSNGIAASAAINCPTTPCVHVKQVQRRDSAGMTSRRLTKRQSKEQAQARRAVRSLHSTRSGRPLQSRCPATSDWAFDEPPEAAWPICADIQTSVAAPVSGMVSGASFVVV